MIFTESLKVFLAFFDTFIPDNFIDLSFLRFGALIDLFGYARFIFGDSFLSVFTVFFAFFSLKTLVFMFDWIFSKIRG